MQRVERERESYKCAGPARAGRANQKGEQQQCSGRVQQHVGKVTPAAVDSEKLGIEHVRKPC